MALLSRSRLIAAKIESSYGSDSSPAGTDAVLCTEIDVTPIESETLSRDTIRSFLGNSDQLLSNTRVAISITTELAGSGTAATASKLDALFRSCGFNVQALGSALTGSSQAGSANSITLAASGPSATDGYYVGHRVAIVSGTGNGHSGLITAYNGTTKVATVVASTATFVPGSSSGYSISAGNKYSPISSSFESCTIKFNNSGVQHVATGCRGTFSLALSTDAIPSVIFNMQGSYNAPTDTSLSGTYTNQTTPVLFKQGNTSASSVLGYTSAAIQSLNVDISNDLVSRELVGATKSTIITNRAPSGEIVIEAPTIAQKDYFTIANNNTTGVISCLHGDSAGNRIGLVMPICDIGNPTYSDDAGVQMLNLPFVPTPSSTGNDEIALVTM
ncbi:MAG TPA: hypothetical protein DG048_03690 [Pseudoalteromonas sp.]|nr:hypothetical protein [Pseudoalteromonas sp.]|tara:strand:- start:830 stop:1993 length:1164 start_codon:yes stop_codon:yes gene_type:complete